MKLQGDEFRGTERFVIRRRIGSGGMGAVYEAYDRERNDTVALKTLRWHDPTAIYRLKKEFRSLSDVAHPNLVSLYELVADDEDWFYTMELVDGVDFLTYVRSQHAGARGADVARLRNTVRQLAEGVVALHRAGVLHRDLKPSNVLVTPAGRVVVLDFGVAAVVGQSASRTIDDGVWGTVAYMAPEQSAGEYGPPSDWYAVGGMLYEALTGRLPFDGTTPEILSAKARREPPPPGDLVSNLPTDLAELTSALLARKASRRPGDGEVLRRLGAIGPAPGSVAPAPAHPSVLIGRDAELEQLEEAFAAVRGGSGVATYVCGPSGIGKTSVVRCFVERLEGDGRALVLSGRCYERESVPYKALDGVVDHLSRVLKELPREEVEPLLPAEVPALARLFPVLQRVEAIALMPTPDREVAEPLERRRLAFTALRELLGRMSARRPLVVFIDDLQWADLDSVALLDDLLRPPAAPCLLLIASFRSEDMDSQPFQRRLLAHAGSPTSRVCAIGPLGPDDSARLADALLGGRPAGVEAAGVIREAAGSPFLVEQLVRYVLDSRTTSGSTSVGLAEMLDARIRTLPEGTRALLHILAIAGRPLDAKVAHVAAGLEGDERPLVNTLIAAHFLRGTAVPPRLELYHDRMRETLAGALSPGAAARAHLRLARCLEQRGFDDPEALFEHYLAAGERERAARYASRAADKALAALAFDRAALLYQRAIELVPPGGADLTTLRGCLGDALASAGRCPAAAAAYLDAARTAPPAEALEYQRRAAQQLLISGHLQEGLGVIRSVLGSVGLTLAGTPRRALVSLLLQRLWLRVRGLGFREREPHQIPAGGADAHRHLLGRGGGVGSGGQHPRRRLPNPPSAPGPASGRPTARRAGAGRGSGLHGDARAARPAAHRAAAHDRSRAGRADPLGPCPGAVLVDGGHPRLPRGQVGKRQDLRRAGRAAAALVRRRRAVGAQHGPALPGVCVLPPRRCAGAGAPQWCVPHPRTRARQPVRRVFLPFGPEQPRVARERRRRRSAAGAGRRAARMGPGGLRYSPLPRDDGTGAHPPLCRTIGDGVGRRRSRLAGIPSLAADAHSGAADQRDQPARTLRARGGRGQ